LTGGALRTIWAEGKFEVGGMMMKRDDGWVTDFYRRFVVMLFVPNCFDELELMNSSLYDKVFI
jgi:hypothetical protein